jgi:AcrR family transcriptional regulator
MFESGVTGTKMEDVRVAAQVSSSQIYHYFVDKQGCAPGVTSSSSISESCSAAAAARSVRSAAS